MAANFMRCCFSPPVEKTDYGLVKQQNSAAPSEQAKSEFRPVAASVASDFANLHSTVCQDSSTSSAQPNGLDGAPTGEALTKVCSFIQKLVEGRSEVQTPAQSLQRGLQLIMVECQCDSANVSILCDEAKYALVATASKGKEFDLRIHKVQGSGCTADVLTSTSKTSLWWDAESGEAAPTDSHFQGLSFILGVPISLQNKTVGVLSVGFSSKTEASKSQLWFSYLSLAAATLSGVVKDSIFPKCLRLLHSLQEATNVNELVHGLFEGLPTVLGQSSNSQSWYRLSLLNANQTAATLFDDSSQVTQKTKRTLSGTFNSQDNNSGEHFSVDHAAANVMQKVVDLKTTLLKTVLDLKQQVVVEDVQKLLNKSGSASPDIYSTRLVKPPASVFVYPLKVHGNVYGALYCLSSLQTNFNDVAPKLRECCQVLAPQLRHMLVSYMHKEYQVLQSAIYESHSDAGDLAPQQNSSDLNRASFGNKGLTNVASGTVRAPSATDSIKTRLEPRRCVSMSYLGPNEASKNALHAGSLIGALVTGLTDKLNEKRIKSSIDMPWSNNLTELKITGHIGEGGYAKVFKGMWRGLVVAVKVVVDELPEDRASVKHAHEIALLMSLSHPNVLQAYACFTDVSIREFLNECWPRSPELFNHKNYMYLENVASKTCHVEVVEYCDEGNLCTAIYTGLFSRRQSMPIVDAVSMESQTSEGERFVSMRWLLLTLMEIANAMAYLHSMGVVHCDIKPANILMKGSTSDSRGFNIKLSDFGLSRVEDDADDSGFRGNSCGTAAYIAPEVLMMSKKVKNTVDAYAFGIMMWEIFTCRKPYASFKLTKLAREVVLRGLRPAFPPTAPPMYKRLAQSCWAATPEARPTFDTILRQLNVMLISLDNKVIEEFVPNQLDLAVGDTCYEPANGTREAM